MRPHRLRVTAFGPFAGTVEVDLDQVSAAGPFLLRGATGAGKTSLLDAVGYALFGKVPGARGMKQLRSDHAPAGVRTSVELWATVSGRAVHVVRSPDQRRPRTRGTGWTTDKATVQLEVARDLDALAADDCDLRLSGVQEANEELARLVGMTHEQFVQVVLLPQGDFARFLRAKDDERAGVLRALFDTSRFGAVEEHLRRRRDEGRDALAAATRALDDAAARVAAHAGADEPPPQERSVWARALLGSARQDAAEAQGRADVAAQAVSGARSALERATTRARLGGELVRVTEDRLALLARQDEVDSLAAELAAADRAAEVAALHEAHLTARSRADGHRAAAARAVTALAGASPEEDPVDLCDGGAVEGLASRLRADLEVARAAHTRLEHLERDVRRWERLQEQVVDVGTAVAWARQAHADVQERAQELPGRVERVTAELALLRPVAAGSGTAEEQVRRWQDALTRTGVLRDLLREVGGAEVDHLAARAAHREADARLDRLRAARLAGMSAELAAALQPGEPCSVCGSTAHPAPARPEGDGSVSADDEDGARAEAARVAEAATNASNVLSSARTALAKELAELAGRVAPDLTVPEPDLLDPEVLSGLEADVRAASDAATAGAAEVRDAVSAVAGLDARLESLRADQAEVLAAVAAAEAQVESGKARLADARTEVVRLDAELVAALGHDVIEHGPVDVWGDRVRRAAADLDLVRVAAGAVERLLAGLAEAARTAQEAAARAAAEGWDDVITAVAAARPRDWRDRARSEVAAHEGGLLSRTERLAQLTAELGALPADPAAGPLSAEDRPVEDQPDPRAWLLAAQSQVDGLTGVLADAEDRCRELTDRATRLRSVRDELARAVPVLVDVEERTGPLRQRAEAARALADLCTGANEKGIPLSTYVLAAHLEQVVQAANQRLDGMSDGRYTLVHVEEGEDRRRRAGLGLAVLDAWTGVRRPAGTLSGGETFLASLALALGLADVVTAEAGGVRIDALFVDEGFGTLDPDSLDRAMDVLDQLQEHGRMVGVVSHVGELRHRLPRQVVVEGGRGGSTVSVLAG